MTFEKVVLHNFVLPFRTQQFFCTLCQRLCVDANALLNHNKSKHGRSMFAVPVIRSRTRRSGFKVLNADNAK
jgi:hypothetical protein